VNTYDLAYQVLANGYLPDSHPQYPLAPASAIPYQLYRELNDCMTQNFERMVVNARSGYWLKSQIVTTVAGTATYRLPARMCTGGLERVEIAQSSSSSYEPLQEESGTEVVRYELAGSGTGVPERFELRGDAIALLPTPNSSYQLRIWYYIRPSMLVTPQASSSGVTSASLGSLSAPGFTPTLRGLIGSVNTTSRVVNVNVLPNDMLWSAAGFALGSGFTADIVRGYGWYEVVVADALVTVSGTNITIGGSDSLEDVIASSSDPASPHYVRFANQTDWPPLPRDFHRALADLTTVSVLTQLHLLEKAQAFREKISGDLDRFKELLQPRVKNQARLVPMPSGMFSGARGNAFRGGFP